MEQILYDAISSAFSEAENYRARYAAVVQELIQAARNETVRMEYGRGGNTLRRGYYCPALVKDVIVGNCNRGKRIQKYRTPPDFRYSFDRADHLRLAECSNETEVILWEAKREVGLTVDRALRVFGVSLCDHADGAPQSCRLFHHTASTDIWEMYSEDYRFRDGFLDTAEVMNVFYCPSENLRLEFMKNTENDLRSGGFTEEEIREFISGAYWITMHSLVGFKNNGQRLVSYSIKNLLPTPEKYPVVPEWSYEISKQAHHPALAHRTQRINRDPEKED